MNIHKIGFTLIICFSFLIFEPFSLSVQKVHANNQSEIQQKISSYEGRIKRLEQKIYWSQRRNEHSRIKNLQHEIAQTQRIIDGLRAKLNSENRHNSTSNNEGNNNNSSQPRASEVTNTANNGRSQTAASSNLPGGCFIRVNHLQNGPHKVGSRDNAWDVHARNCGGPRDCEGWQGRMFICGPSGGVVDRNLADLANAPDSFFRNLQQNDWGCYPPGARDVVPGRNCNLNLTANRNVASEDRVASFENDMDEVLNVVTGAARETNVSNSPAPVASSNALNGCYIAVPHLHVEPDKSTSSQNARDVHAQVCGGVGDCEHIGYGWRSGVANNRQETWFVCGPRNGSVDRLKDNGTLERLIRTDLGAFANVRARNYGCYTPGAASYNNGSTCRVERRNYNR